MSPTHGIAARHDLAKFVAQPRLTGLAISPDGSRLVVAARTLSEDGTRYVSGLWEFATSGSDDSPGPVRLTESQEGEAAPAFAPDGTLLFLSGRAAGESDGGDVGVAVWSESGRLATHPGGIAAFTVAKETGTLAYTAGLLPGATDAESHAELRERRRAAGVSAILYDAGPTRSGSRDLGPDEPHTFVRRTGDVDHAVAGADRIGIRGDGTVVDAGGQGLAGQGDMALAPDGGLVAYTRAVGGVPEHDMNVLVIADARNGTPRRLVSRPGCQYYGPLFTADGTALICQRQREETFHAPWEVTLVAIDPATGEERDLLPDFDNWPWPGRAVVSPVAGDGTVWFTGDERGHCPVFRRDPDGTVTRLTASGAYSALCAAPDGRTLYALRAAIDSPPRVVRLDAAAPEQRPAAFPFPGERDRLPGTLTEVHATGDDGCPLRAWLALPPDASAHRPAPLVVAPHGGPQFSWSTWSWGLSPWPFTSRGYAVLLPDPALSTGYGQRMQERGHGGWGGRPYDDVLALTDAALARDDLDAGRTALAGASFGGYLANRAATRTDRFRAIVSFAGTWNLPAFLLDSDLAPNHLRTFGDPLTRPERYLADSPHLDAARLSTPMLVAHGGRDHRVPLGQGLGLFQDLQRAGVPVRFLYFPDESHGLERPNNLRLWYETVLNFLDHHVCGGSWERPQLL